MLAGQEARGAKVLRVHWLIRTSALFRFSSELGNAEAQVAFPKLRQKRSGKTCHPGLFEHRVGKLAGRHPVWAMFGKA